MPCVDLVKRAAFNRAYRLTPQRRIREAERAIKRRDAGEWRTPEKRAYSRAYYHKLRSAVLDFLGNKCVRCGFNDMRILQIDHVNGGGSKELKSGFNRGRYFKHVLAHLQAGGKDYQLLCPNCNWLKAFENDETTRIRDGWTRNGYPDTQQEEELEGEPEPADESGA